MSIFFHAINELKRVPTDAQEDNYEELDTDANEDETSGNEEDDNYDLPQGEEDNQEDPGPESEDDNYELPGDSQDDTTGDETNQDNPPEDNQTDEYNELQDLEDEVFQNLRGGEKKIRDKELLKLYIDMYNDISSILSRINNIPKTERIIQPLEYCTDKLTDIREILYSYILSSYKIKTYIENMTNYYEFLATLQAINKILSELGEKDDNKD